MVIKRKAVLKTIYTKYTKLALKICFDAHKEQVDKSGLPYVFHPFHVAEQMKDEDTVITALLHDVLEDTSLTVDDLREYGFSEVVLDALTALCHDPDTDYMDYIAEVKKNPVAAAVKLEDLKHNSDLTRLDEVTAKDIKRHEKYQKAIAFLKKTADNIRTKHTL